MGLNLKKILRFLLYFILIDFNFANNNKDSRSNDEIDDAWVYRLPKNIIPISYNLRILTKLAANDFFYEAEVRITLDALEKTNTIILHAHKLRIDKDKSFLYRGTDKILIHDQYLDKNKQFYIIKCMKYLEVGRYTLVLSFLGEIQDDVFGFYRSSYEVDGQKK